MKTSATQAFGYIYGIILKAIDKNLTVEEAVELIRKAFSR